MLARGSMGELVRAWQGVLKAHQRDTLTVDGEFGPETEAATREFQARLGVEPDGIVGPETVAAYKAAGFTTPFSLEMQAKVSPAFIVAVTGFIGGMMLLQGVLGGKKKRRT